MFSRTKSVVKKSLVNNVGYMKRVVGTKEIADNAKWISQMWKSLAKPKVSRVENFEQAKIRQNVNDDDLIKIRRNYIVCFYIVFTGFVFCGGMFVHNMVSGVIPGMLSAFGIGLVLLASAFKFSFRAYQLKIGELCGVEKYLRNMKEWIAH